MSKQHWALNLVGGLALVCFMGWAGPDQVQAADLDALTPQLGTVATPTNTALDLTTAATPATILYSGTSGTCAWDIDSQGVLTIHAGNLGSVYNTGGPSKTSMWAKYNDAITSVVLDGTVVLPDRSEYLFSNLTKVQEMDLTGLDTSQATVFSSMFLEDSALITLKGLDTWDTSQVTGMGFMFSGAKALTAVDIANWDVHNVTTTAAMFQSCASLKRLDLSQWDVHNATNINSMFSNSGLEYLNLNGWATQQITELNGLFRSCSNLVTLDLGHWDTSQVTNLTTTFAYCSSLVDLNLTGWDTSQVTTMNSTFMGCSSLVTVDVGAWDTSQVTTMQNMFQGCAKLTMVDVSRWQLGQVTDISSMFSGAAALTQLDVSAWDTSQVTTLRAAFTRCTDLTDLDVSRWQTGHVTNMSNLFTQCEQLETLDVSAWDTSQVTTIYLMFSGMAKIKTLDVSAWDTHNMTSMASAFYGTSQLQTLDVSHWDTSQVKSFESMFNAASQLTALDVANWDTRQATSLRLMFRNASRLATLDVSNWDTSQVTDMGYMFQGATSLTTLDLSHWDMRQVTVDDKRKYMLDFGQGNHLWQLTLGPNIILKGIEGLPAAPGNDTPILDSAEPTYYSISPNWQVVDTTTGGTVHQPKGALYTAQEIQTAYAPEATRTQQTFVWQQQPVIHLDMTVPTLDFGKTAVGGGLRRRAVADWGITVTNTSEPVATVPVQLSVALTQPFTNAEGTVVPDILIFRDAKNQDTVIDAQPRSIFSGTVTDADQTTLQWDADHGFLLYLQPEQAIDPGHYTATLTWQLTTGPS